MPKILHEFTFNQGNTKFKMVHKELGNTGYPNYVVVESGWDVLEHWEDVTSICVDHLMDVLGRIKREIGQGM